jgi:hypothetical protein
LRNSRLSRSDHPTTFDERNTVKTEKMTTEEALEWAFQQNYHADKMNAAIHCSTVRYSPLTFRLAEQLGPQQCNLVEGLALVLHDLGAYAEDRGR